MMMKSDIPSENIQAGDVDQRLIESETRYRSLYNNAPVMLNSVDSAGTLLTVNNHWLATLGYGREEVLGRLASDFLTESSREYLTKVAATAFSDRDSVSGIELQMVKKDGDIIDVQLSAVVERDQNGQISEVLGFLVDVTRKKRQEEELRYHREQLEELVDRRTAALSRVNRRLVNEVDERRQAEADVIQLNLELLSIQAAGTAVASSLDIHQVIYTLNEQMMGLLGMDGCKISDWDQESGMLSAVPESSSVHWYGIRATNTVMNVDDYPLTRRVIED